LIFSKLNREAFPKSSPPIKLLYFGLHGASRTLLLTNVAHPRSPRSSQRYTKYGAAGGRPQVVWSNGILASTAVGIITQLLTPWLNNPPDFIYLDYDGNLGTLTPNDRMNLFRGKTCSHHPNHEVGDPLFDVREFNTLRAELALRKTTPVSGRQTLNRWQRIWTSFASVFRQNRSE